MADGNSVDEVIAAGEASSGSPKVISAPTNCLSSRHASLALPSDQARDIGDGHMNLPESQLAAAPCVTDIEERQSPTASTSFSEAPTAITGTSDYTTNTGGRARYSWRGDFANLWRPSSRGSSRNASVSNPPPPTRQERIGSASTAISSDDDLPAELPAAAVLRPDEPRSFFDSDSESEGETIIRTASRASSYRAQAPRLIGHPPSTSSLGQTRFYRSGPLGGPGPSQGKAEQILGTRLKNLYDLTPHDEKANPLASAVNKSLSAHGAAGRADGITSPATVTTQPPGPSPSQRPVGSSLVVEVPNTSMRTEALETLPSPFAGFGAIRLDGRKSSQMTLSPLDALRSNPVTRFDVAGLQRATSAPPIPQAQRRRVKIRPMDMEAIRSADEKKLFRDSVVSTPYPFRHHSMSLPGEQGSPPGGNKKIKTLRSTAEEGSKPTRVASHASPPEVLVLELSLAKHRLATKMATVAIYDRSTFDDCALFMSLRGTYKQDLLGFTRRFFSARTLSDATMVFSSASFSLSSSSTNPEATPIHFNTVSFLKHLARPQCGRKRKTWLRWLRTCQPRARSASCATMTTSACFSPDGIPRTPAFVDPRPPPAPPRSNSDHYPSSPTSTHQSPYQTNPCSTAKIPKIILHHSFSPVRLAISMAILIFVTTLATVLWTIFGYPGPRPGDERTEPLFVGLDGAAGLGWRLAAQKRVMTGVLLGLLVFCLGGAQLGCWIVASWATL